MLRTALDTLKEADTVIFLADASLPLEPRIQERQQRDLAHLETVRVPKVLALPLHDRSC